MAGVIGALALVGSVAECKEKATVSVELLCPAVQGKKGQTLSRDQKRQTSLHNKLTKIAKGGNINATDKNGQTALMYAAALNNRLAVCWLVAKGADVTLKSAKGKTARDLATGIAIRELLEICANEKPHTADKADIPEDDITYKGQYLPKLVEMMQQGADLTHAVEGEFLPIECSFTPECIAYMVRHGYDVNTRTPSGALPLRMWGKKLKSGQRIRLNMEADCVQLMMALGLQAQQESEKLFLALLSDDIAAVRQLLKDTPDLIRLKAPSDLPLLTLAQSGAGVRALLDAGADVKDILAKRDYDGFIAQEMYMRPVTSTLLDTALLKDASYMQEILKELSAQNIPLPPSNGLTLLHQAQDAAMVDVLLEAGLDTETKNWRGETPLIWAAVNGNADVVQELVAKGAKIKDGDMADVMEIDLYIPFNMALSLQPGGVSESLFPKWRWAMERYETILPMMESLFRAGLKATEETLGCILYYICDPERETPILRYTYDPESELAQKIRKTDIELVKLVLRECAAALPAEKLKECKAKALEAYHFKRVPKEVADAILPLLQEK